MQVRPFVVSIDDIKLSGEVVRVPDPRALVVICHGIPSGRPDDPNDHDPGYPGLVREIAGYGYVTAWFDLRGVRASEGDFSVVGWERDLVAVLEHLTAQPDLSALPVVVVGTSGSGPTAIRVAASSPRIDAVATLAAVATWTESGFLPDPETLLVHFRSIGIIRDPSFPSDTSTWADEFRRGPLGVIGRIAPRPLCIIHGEADTAVPYHHAEQLFERAGEPKELVRIPNGSHQLRRDPRAIAALTDWLSRVLQPVRSAR